MTVGQGVSIELVFASGGRSLSSAVGLWIRAIERRVTERIERAVRAGAAAAPGIYTRERERGMANIDPRIRRRVLASLKLEVTVTGTSIVVTEVVDHEIRAARALAAQAAWRAARPAIAAVIQRHL